MNKKIFCRIEIIVLIIPLFGVLTLAQSNSNAIVPYFNLIAKTNGGGFRSDYLNLFAQQVAVIGINIDVIVQDWPTFVNELMVLRNFDICYTALTGGSLDPDFSGVYTENGSLNLFGYDESMDWNQTLTLGDRTGWGINEWYIQKGIQIIPPTSEERIQHYWEWQDYMMDNILPCLPAFAPKVYMAQWQNLDGYNFSEGILHSWGKMSFKGSHTGQENSSEVVIYGAPWHGLNPLFDCDDSSNFIQNAIIDPLFYIDPDGSIWPHLAKWWRMENDTTFVVNVRQGIKWQPDLEGNFTDEYLDIQDVYFTLYCLKEISNYQSVYKWIEKMEIVNDTCLRVYIDGDPSTLKNDIYVKFLTDLSVKILPEHYLNQTQLGDGVTPDISHDSWAIFDTSHCFGTNIFKFHNYIENVELTLASFDQSWMLNSTLTNYPTLDFQRRFGNFTGGLNQLRIEFIPNIYDAFIEFEQGKLDIIGITSYPEKIAQYKDDVTKKIQSDTQFYFGFFGYNMRQERSVIGNRDPCVNDLEISIGLAIRKAISYATNREEINNVVHNGELAILHHPIYPSKSIWCNPNIIHYNYNLTLANEYIEKIGLPKSTTPIIYSTTVIPAYLLLITIITLLIIQLFSSMKSKRRIKKKFNKTSVIFIDLL